MAGIKQIKPIGARQPIKTDLWLSEIIDEHLDGTMFAPRTGVFHPSVISNACDRYVWLCYHGKMVDQPLPAKLQRIFQNGSFLEERVEVWLKNLNILVDREVSVKQDIPPISGRIDFLIKHYDFGLIPIELKSINTAGFAKLRGPKPEHQTQIQMYLNMGNYDKGTVLYENKNDQKIKTFIVDRDPEQWADILERCFRIQETLVTPEKCGGASWCNCKLVPMGSV
tara:strand:+ start:107 stop:781 length:675 start_codon:yes stop_codon:yes gene_type:complete